MLSGTTLPPVIEGCNSREVCESFGRPYIYGSGKHSPLKQYTVLLSDKQRLQTQASRCLQTGDRACLPELSQYMKESLSQDKTLQTYHQQRQAAFLARPDACERFSF